MAERLKDMFFTQESVSTFADTIKNNYPGFDKKRFMELVFDETFESKELIARMAHTTLCLNQTLPKSYKDALLILKKAAPSAKGFESLTLPDYVATYGLENWDLSLPALGYFTQYSTSELAVRPFLAENPDKVMPFMMKWAGDKSPKIRRFASEGCRPRLPWAMALPKFKKDPSVVIKVLEILKDDDSEDVRRSVANNLNDISKDNPEITLDVCERWFGHTKNRDRLVKHACRTLLKAGHKRALAIFGYSDPASINVQNLRADKEQLNIGDDLRFSFDLNLTQQSKVRLEYAVSYVKANGKLSKKVFKLTENNYDPGTRAISRKQTFRDMSTRKHYPGTHHIAIIVNGVEKASISFELKE